MRDPFILIPLLGGLTVCFLALLVYVAVTGELPPLYPTFGG